MKVRITIIVLLGIVLFMAANVIQIVDGFVRHKQCVTEHSPMPPAFDKYTPVGQPPAPPVHKAAKVKKRHGESYFYPPTAGVLIWGNQSDPGLNTCLGDGCIVFTNPKRIGDPVLACEYKLDNGGVEFDACPKERR